MRLSDIEIVEDDVCDLADHAVIPSSFTVDVVVDVHETKGGGLALTERELRTPYLKDYDRVEHPSRWLERFDMTNWGLLAAYRNEKRIGGAVIAPEGVELLEGRSDLAILWDLRMAPEQRRRGTGRALFTAAEAWSRARGRVELKVETQNINVTACRFYAAQGCELRAANRGAYGALPEEIQLLWYKRL